MRLTPRDERLLTGFGHFRVLTLQQVQRYYFGGAARNNVQERLSQLRDAKLLRAFPFGEHGKLAWTITAEAARAIGRPPHIFRRPPNRNTLPHDLVAAEIGLRLGEMGVLHEWISAYELQIRAAKPNAEVAHVPDAVFRLKFGENIVGPIALEVENTYKSLARIEKRIDDYRCYGKMTDLWFLWREDWMGRTLKKLPRILNRDFRHEPPLRVWIGKKSYNDDLDLTLEGPKDEVLDVAALAGFVTQKVQTPVPTEASEKESIGLPEGDDESSQEVERLRARRTPNSDGLITRANYPYTYDVCGVVGTAGPMELGCGERKEKLDECGKIEGGEREKKGMTERIKGLESGEQG